MYVRAADTNPYYYRTVLVIVTVAMSTSIAVMLQPILGLKLAHCSCGSAAASYVHELKHAVDAF